MFTLPGQSKKCLQHTSNTEVKQPHKSAAVKAVQFEPTESWNWSFEDFNLNIVVCLLCCRHIQIRLK